MIAAISCVYDLLFWVCCLLVRCVCWLVLCLVTCLVTVFGLVVWWVLLWLVGCLVLMVVTLDVVVVYWMSGFGLLGMFVWLVLGGKFLGFVVVCVAALGDGCD